MADKIQTPAEGFAKAKQAVAAEGGFVESLKKSANASQHSFWDNFAHAIFNKLLGTEQGITHLADALGIPKAPTVSTAKIDQLVKESRPTEGWGGFFGDVAATLPFAALGGGPVAQGVTQGLVGAAAEPVRGQSYGDVKGTQLAIGGVTGLAAGLLGRYLGAPAARNPEAWNKEILNVAAPPGSPKITEVGHDGVKALADAWDAAYARVEPNLRVGADLQLATDLAGIVRSMPAQGATADEVNAVKNIIKGQIDEPLMSQGNFLTGEAVNKVQSSLRKIAESKPAIADAVYAVRDRFLGAAERWSPEAAQELAQLRQQYPALLAVRKAAAKSTTDDGIFTPDQLASATSIVDKAGASIGQAPFQSEISAGRAQRVGKPGALAETFAGFPILGPLLRQAERSTTLQKAGQVTGAGLELGAGPASAVMGREQQPPQQIPGTGEGLGTFAPQNGPSPELQQRLDQFWGPDPNQAPTQAQQLDQTFGSPQQQQPAQPGAPTNDLNQRLDQFWGPTPQPSPQMRWSPTTWGAVPPGQDPRFTSALRPIVNQLANLGVTLPGIAGVISNAAFESGGQPTAVGDNGNAIGALQWNGPRKVALEQYAQRQNASPFDPNVQARYLVSELTQPQYAPLLRRLQTATNDSHAAMDFQQNFERPAVIDPRRGALAPQASAWLRLNGPIAAPSGYRATMT